MFIKNCKSCGAAKSTQEFGKELRNRDGLNGKCKECCSIYNLNLRALWASQNIKEGARRDIDMGLLQQILEDIRLNYV